MAFWWPVRSTGIYSPNNPVNADARAPCFTRISRRAPVTGPQSKKKDDSEGTLADPAELDLILKRASAMTITAAEICKAFEVEKLADLKNFQIPLVMQFLANPADGVPE